MTWAFYQVVRRAGLQCQALQHDYFWRPLICRRTVAAETVGPAGFLGSTGVFEAAISKAWLRLLPLALAFLTNSVTLAARSALTYLSLRAFPPLDDAGAWRIPWRRWA